MTCRTVRIAPCAAGDANVLASFQCSTGEACEDEVQDFVRNRARSFTADAALERDRSLDLAWHNQDLVGVVLHERADQFDEEGTYLRVVAVRTDWRGIELLDGRTLANTLADHAVLGTRRGPALAAHVDPANVRSVALLRKLNAMPIREKPNEDGMLLFAAYLPELE